MHIVPYIMILTRDKKLCFLFFECCTNLKACKLYCGMDKVLLLKKMTILKLQIQFNYLLKIQYDTKFLNSKKLYLIKPFFFTKTTIIIIN